MRSGQVSRQVGTAQQSKLVASRTSRSSGGGGSTMDDSHSVSRESRSLSINEGRERNPRPRRSSAARERERQERQERKRLEKAGKERKSLLSDGPDSSETNSSNEFDSTRNSGYSLSESVGPDDQAQLLRAIRDYETKSSKSEHSRSTGGHSSVSANGTPSVARRAGNSNHAPNERLQMSGSDGAALQAGASGLHQSAPSGGKKTRKTEIVFAVGNKKLGSISLGGKPKDKEKRDKEDEKKEKQRGSSGNLKLMGSDARPDAGKDNPLHSPTSNNTSNATNANVVNTNAASSTTHYKESGGSSPKGVGGATNAHATGLSSSAPSRARDGQQLVLGALPSIAVTSAHSSRRTESPRPALHPLIGNILLTVYRVSRARFYRCAALNKEWRRESQIILTSYVRDHSPTAQAALANATPSQENLKSETTHSNK